MARIDQRALAVCDAGPLIHLAELDSLALLVDFRVWVPEAVWQEVSRHRPEALLQTEVHFERRTVARPIAPSLSALGGLLLLDAGELEGLALMSVATKALFLTDDAAARLAAEQLGYRVHGTIGVLLRAIRQERLAPTEVVRRLQSIPLRSTLHIRSTLLDDIIHRVKQEYEVL
jgi:predicted nucleic acid-binding protein